MSLVTCLQASKAQNSKANPATGLSPELKRSSSSDKAKEEAVAESAADEEKKLAVPAEEKKARPQKIMEFHNIKISQVGSSFGPLDEVVTYYQKSSPLLK